MAEVWLLQEVCRVAEVLCPWCPRCVVAEVWPLQEVCRVAEVLCPWCPRCVVAEAWPLREVCRDRCVAVGHDTPPEGATPRPRHTSGGREGHTVKSAGGPLKEQP